jgi:hypothetical protein
VNAPELLAALQTAIDKHSWPHYQKVEGTVSPACACGAQIRTTTAWLEHLKNDVLPEVVRSIT